MIRHVNNSAAGTGSIDSARLSREQYVDIHCHCLPALDDGPATMAESLALCKALADDGITTVVATPHQLGRFSDCNDAQCVRAAVAELNEKLETNGIDLTILAGGDVRVDERICQLLAADKILTLADNGKYILLEPPHEIFIDIEPLLVDLSSRGVQIVISHPERNAFISKRPDALLRWLEHSVHLQLTAGSLLGKFGNAAQKNAWHLLESGLATLVATDAHDILARRPCMRAAFQRITTVLGETVARLICAENPSRVLKGQDLVPIDAASLSLSRE